LTPALPAEPLAGDLLLSCETDSSDSCPSGIAAKQRPGGLLPLAGDGRLEPCVSRGQLLAGFAPPWLLACPLAEVAAAIGTGAAVFCAASVCVGRISWREGLSGPVVSELLSAPSFLTSTVLHARKMANFLSHFSASRPSRAFSPLVHVSISWRGGWSGTPPAEPAGCGRAPPEGNPLPSFPACCGSETPGRKPACSIPSPACRLPAPTRANYTTRES
jgi:hypothetical protein